MRMDWASFEGALDGMYHPTQGAPGINADTTVENEAVRNPAGGRLCNTPRGAADDGGAAGRLGDHAELLAHWRNAAACIEPLRACATDGTGAGGGAINTALSAAAIRGSF